MEKTFPVIMFLKIILVCYVIGVFCESLYKKLDLGESISATIVAEFTVSVAEECSLR